MKHVTIKELPNGTKELLVDDGYELYDVVSCCVLSSVKTRNPNGFIVRKKREIVEIHVPQDEGASQDDAFEEEVKDTGDEKNETEQEDNDVYNDSDVDIIDSLFEQI